MISPKESLRPLGRGAGKRDQTTAVLGLDHTIHLLNLYPMDSAASFVNTYPLDSDLSVGSAL